MSVTPQTTSNYIKNFPFPTLRDKQSYVLKEIDAAFTSGYKYIVLEAPTGFGKSPVAIATVLTLGSSYICTSTKDLQTEYARDFPFVRVAKGKNNFTCEVKDDFIRNDLSDFWAAARAGNMPAVSYLKHAAYQDGHPGDSDPIDEQNFLVNTINRLQQLPEWNSTAIIIAYDDSGGWYDHAMPPIISQSNDPINDALLGPNQLCGHAPAGAYQDRCGYWVRLPMLVISPYAKVNYDSGNSSGDLARVLT